MRRCNRRQPAVAVSLCALALVTGCRQTPRFKAYPLDDSARGLNGKGEFLTQPGGGRWVIADVDGHSRSIPGLPANAAPQMLNDRGDVAGVIFTDPACQSDNAKRWCLSHPFLLADGKLAEFEGLGVWSNVTALTNHDDLGGAFHETDAPDALPFVVLGGKSSRPALPAPYVHGQIAQMNDFGRGVGTMWDITNRVSQGFMESEGRVLPFPSLDGGGLSFGVAIDKHSNLGGSQRVGDLRFATTIEKGTVRAIQTPGLADCIVEAIDLPEVVLDCHPENSKQYAMYLQNGTRILRLGDLVEWPAQKPEQNMGYCKELKDGRLLVTYSVPQVGGGYRSTNFMLVKQAAWPRWLWTLVGALVVLALVVALRRRWTS